MADLYLIENITGDYEVYEVYGLVHIPDYIMEWFKSVINTLNQNSHWTSDPVINVYKIDMSFIRAATDKDPNYDIIYDEYGNKYCLTKEIRSGGPFGNHKLNKGVELIC